MTLIYLIWKHTLNLWKTVVGFGILEPFLTRRELELLYRLPEFEGKTFSKAADGYTTRKRVLKKFKDAGLISFCPGEPIQLTELGRELLG